MKKFHKLLGLLALFLMGLASPAFAQTPLTLSVLASFSPTIIDTATYGGGTTLTITITSNAGVVQAGTLALATITYPASMTNTFAPTTTCGGTVVGSAGGNTIGLTGGSLASLSSCTVTASVAANLAGTYNITVNLGAVTAIDGLFGGLVSSTGIPTATAFIGVPQAPTLSNPLNFGSVQIFTSSPTTSDVTITNGATFGPFYKIVGIASSNTADFTIDPATTCVTGAPGLTWGGSCLYAIRFTPTTAPGLKTVTYTITDNAPGSPRTFTLTGTAIAGVPGAPTIGAATPGNAQATISYAPPVFDGGSAITGYTATCNPGAFSISGPASAPPLTVTGLVNGTTYLCSVTATNVIGTSASSATVNVTPRTVPGAPVIGAATPGNTQASIAFAAPVSNGGSAITGYTTTCNPGAISAGGAASPITVTGLANGTTYACSVTATNAAGTGPPSATVSVTPTPGVGTLSAAPLSLGFGNVTAGALSAQLTVTASNTSLIAPLTFTGVTASGPFMVNNTCPLSPATLPASGACTIGVRFSPISAGPQTGVLTVATNGGTQTVALSGTGLVVPTPNVRFSPTSLQFGTQPVGTQSLAQSVLLSNGGTAALNVSAVATSGDFIAQFGKATVFQQLNELIVIPKSFALGGGTALASGGHDKAIAGSVQCPVAPFSLPPGTNCFIDVVFAPAAGGAWSGALTVSSNAPPASVPLSGAGGQGRLISVIPATFEFGSLTLNTPSDPLTFTITNVGTSPVTFTSIGFTISGQGDFVITHNCTVLNTLASGAGNTCTGTVTFLPSAIGVRSGFLNIASDAQNSPLQLGSQGMGLLVPGEALLTTSASSQGFGQSLVGMHSQPLMVRVTNSGDLPVDIATIQTGGDFHRSHTCPATLASAQSCIVTTWFIPSIAGVRGGELTIMNSGKVNPQRTAFQGTGCLPFSAQGSRETIVNCAQ